MNILLNLPTGYGKTKQAFDRCKSFKSMLVVIYYTSQIASWKEEIKKWKENPSKFSFITYKSFPKNSGTYDCIIFDECHHLSERCLNALNNYSFDNSILLSATVGRNKMTEIKRVFPNIEVISKTPQEAIHEKKLPTPKLYLLEMNLDNAEKKYIIVKNKSKNRSIDIDFKDRFKYKRKDVRIRILCTQKEYYEYMEGMTLWLERRKNFSDRDRNAYLRQAGERTKWLAEIKEMQVKKLQDKFKDKRMITFCKDIAQCERLGGSNVTSKNKNSMKVLEDFNKGKIDSITACNMLNEGINLTDCQIGIFTYINASDRLVIQKTGRIMRHEKPIIFLPYYKGTREEELINNIKGLFSPENCLKIHFNQYVI